MENIIINLFKNLEHAKFIQAYHEEECGKDWLCIDIETGWDPSYLTMEIGTFDDTALVEVGEIINYINDNFPNVEWDGEHFYNEGDTTYMFHVEEVV